MLKLKIFFVLAGLLITIVMVRTVLLGVQLPERAMVKWSWVEDTQATSARIADFLYPMLKQQKGVCFSGESAAAQSFVEGLKARLDKRNLPIWTTQPESPGSEDCFTILVREMNPSLFKELCPKGDSEACVGLRAFEKLENKIETDSNKNWISLYRLDNQKAILFYFTKQLEL